MLNRKQANATEVIQNQQENHIDATKERTIHQDQQQIQPEETSADLNPMEALFEMINVLEIQLPQQQIAHFFKDYFSLLVDLARRQLKQAKDRTYYENNYYYLYQELKKLSIFTNRCTLRIPYPSTSEKLTII